LSVELARVAQAQGVGDLASPRYCVETHSRRTTRDGLFDRLFGLADPDVEHWTTVVLTRAAVLVGVHGEKRGTRVFFVPLVTLELGDGLGSGSIAFRSPAIGAGPNGPASYSVYFGSSEHERGTREALRAALAELRG
jgi:hypothetical protein